MTKLVLFVVMLIYVLISGLSWILNGILEAGKDILHEPKDTDKNCLGIKDLIGRLGVATFMVIGILEIPAFYHQFIA